MAVIEADFTPKQRTFDYAAFRAEFIRRKRMTSYQRANEDGERARAETRASVPPPTAEGVPFWAEYQIEPGIMNTVHIWQAERYCDPDTGIVRYTNGVLEQVRNIYSAVEADAINCIEHQALVWKLARGRTTLTPQEHRIHALSVRYLRECDTFVFQAKNRGFEPCYYPNGELVEKIMHGWIGKVTGFTPSYIEELLIIVENVYALRAVLGMDEAPEVRVQVAARRDSSAAA